MESKPKKCGHCKKEIREIAITKNNRISAWCKKCYERHQISLVKYNAKIRKTKFELKSIFKTSTKIQIKSRSKSNLDLILLAIDWLDNNQL